MQFTDSNPENVHKTVTKVFREVKEAIQNSLFTKMSGVDKCNVIKERNDIDDSVEIAEIFSSPQCGKTRNSL